LSRLNFAACFFFPVTCSANALNLLTWEEARRQQWSGRRRRTSTHQPSSSSRPAVSGFGRHRSYSPEPDRRRRHHRRRQHSRSHSCCRSRSPSSIISRAPSPLQFAPSSRRFSSPRRRFRKRLWNPSQRQRAAAKRFREGADEAPAGGVELLARPPPTSRFLPKARPACKRPSTPPRQTAHPATPQGLLAAAPKVRPGAQSQAVSRPAVPCPAGDRPPPDRRITLYAFGSDGPSQGHIRKSEP
jgi:hypothetical protein